MGFNNKTKYVTEKWKKTFCNMWIYLVYFDLQMELFVYLILVIHDVYTLLVSSLSVMYIFCLAKVPSIMFFIPASV